MQSILLRPRNPPLLGIRSSLETSKAKSKAAHGGQRLSRALGRHSLIEPDLLQQSSDGQENAQEKDQPALNGVFTSKAN